jgi:hypothetical protein
VGGHLELAQVESGSSTLAEFMMGGPEIDVWSQIHVVECDADAFAGHITSLVHTDKAMAELLGGILCAPEWEPSDLALLVYLMAISTLFRLLFPKALVKISQCKSSHPHPAVRACLVASSTMARGLFGGSYTTDTLDRILAGSVGNLEAVWATLNLPGQNPEPARGWSQDLQATAIDLFKSYGGAKPRLDQYARIPRRWDDWEWPETSRST